LTMSFDPRSEFGDVKIKKISLYFFNDFNISFIYFLLELGSFVTGWNVIKRFFLLKTNLYLFSNDNFDENINFAMLSLIKFPTLKTLEGCSPS
jgi:hypothetical protein